MALDLLREQIEKPGQTKPMTVQLPCELVRRQSVKALPVERSVRREVAVG